MNDKEEELDKQRIVLSEILLSHNDGSSSRQCTRGKKPAEVSLPEAQQGFPIHLTDHLFVDYVVSALGVKCDICRIQTK